MTRLNQFFRSIAVAMLCFSATAAAAGGMNDPPAERPFIWSGTYVGVHAGYAWTDTGWDLRYPFGAGTFSNSFDNSGAILGGHIGWQRQHGSWVTGIEVSLSGGFDSDTRRGINLFGASTAGTLSTDINMLMLATGRLGYAWDRSMVYVKGGYALARMKLDTDDNVPGDFISLTRDYYHGWTAGGGYEYMLTPNVILGLEYNYVDLNGNASAAVTNLAGTPVSATLARSEIDTTIHSVMARLSFKLGR
jgi:outer membrane immunogenic protein